MPQTQKLRPAPREDRMPAAQAEMQPTTIAAQAYATLPQLLLALHQAPPPDDVRLAAARDLAALGLRSAADELVATLPDSRPGARAVRTTIESLPDDRIDTTPESPCFRANLEALRDKIALDAELDVALVRALRSLQVHRCADGEVQVSRRIGSGPRRWLPTIAPWRTNTRSPKLVPPAGSHFCPPYVLDGIGTGELLDHVRRGTAKMFLTFSPRIHVLEANLSALAAWMCIADWREIIADPRVHFWIGIDAAARLRAYYESNADLAMPTQVIRSPGWGAKLEPPAELMLRELNLSVEAKAERVRERVLEQYAASPSRLDDEAASGLRVLGITSRFTTFLQHSMRDTGQALAARGHEFRLLLERDDHTHGVPPLHTLRQIEEFRPDLILVIDHNRAEYGRTLDLPIPFCNWIQDELPHLFNPGSGAQTRGDDLIVGVVSSRSARIAGYPQRQVRYVPVPVNQRVFHAAMPSEGELAKVRCDVSFVSNLSITADRFVADIKQQHTRREVHQLIDGLRETLEPMIAAGDVPSTPFRIERLIHDTARQLGFAITNELAARFRREFVDRLVNILFRQQPLIWAADAGLDLHLYGRGWESHPRLARFARGVAEHGEHLRQIFAASRVNLQLYPGPGIHQRLLEGLASGGFFMIRGTPADAVAPLYQSVARRVVEAGIRSEQELAARAEPALRIDVAALCEVLSGSEPHEGFVEQLHDFDGWAWKLDMPTALPGYAGVRFAGRADFEARIREYLSDEGKRVAAAEGQLRFVLEHFTYDRVVEEILTFGRAVLKNRARPTEEISDRKPRI